MRADTCHSPPPAQPHRLTVRRLKPTFCAMSREKATGQAKKQRLAKALKANLARRKAQEKSRTAPQDTAQPAKKD